MKFFLLLCTLLGSFTSYAGEEFTDFNIKGELIVEDPTVVPLINGEYKMGSAQRCNFFKCQNKRLVLKNDESSFEITLPRNVSVNWEVINFDELKKVDFETPDALSELKVHFKSKFEESKVQFVLTEVPRNCERVCIERSQTCRGSQGSFGRCDYRGSDTTCERYTTTCTPAYESCIKETRAPVKLEMIITDLRTGKVAANFLSNERVFKESETVKMSNCFPK